MSDIYSLVGPAKTLAITAEEAIRYLRIEGEEDLQSLAILIRAVVQNGELRTGTSFSVETWKLTRDGFPADTRICLRRRVINTIVSVQYLKWDDVSDHTTETVPATDYYLKLNEFTAQVLLLSNAPTGSIATGAWPTDVSLQQSEANVFVTFTTRVPQCIEAIKAALWKHLAAVWSNRGDCLEAGGVVIGGRIADLCEQSGAQGDLDFFRIPRI